LRQFLLYLFAGIEKEFPGSCTELRELISQPELPPARVLASHLLNELDALEGPCSIALDDYHLLHQSSPVHALMETILEHPPIQVHLVLIARREPPLRLTRLRALNQMRDIRLQDLRFTHAEIAELVASCTSHSVSEKALAHLQQEIEGWAAGLRLILLVLPQSPNPDEFLISLRGGIPQIQEYLLNEVLVALSTEQREYLLKSSVLERFNGELIESVCEPGLQGVETAQWTGSDFIRFSQQQNLFIISLDPLGRWFRFHHLFQFLLQKQLSRSVPAQQLSELHLRASQWFEANEYIDEAIVHTLKAGDELSAARIVERHCYAELETGNWYVVGRWLALIPLEITEQRLNLVLAQAWAATFNQDIEKVAELCEIAHSLVIDAEDNSGAAAEIDFFDGYLLFFEGNHDECIALLERAQRGIEKHKAILLAETDLHLALARYMNGQGDIGVRMINEQIRKLGNIHLSRRVGTLAFIRMLSADLGELMVEARRMRAMDPHIPSPVVDAWSHYFEACADLHSLRLESALNHFGIILSRPHTTDRVAVTDAFASAALAQQLLGLEDKATETITRMMSYLSDSNDPASRTLGESCQARIHLLQGNLEPAIRWARSFSEAPGLFDLFLWVEVPALTRVRALLAEGSVESLAMAQDSIVEIRAVCEQYHFTAQLIEVAVLETLLLATSGKKKAALQSLKLTVDLAEPGGWVRPFIECGPDMAGLIESLHAQGENRRYIGHLLQAFSSLGTASQNDFQADNKTIPATATPEPGGMPEELTNRELDILELLSQRLQNKEIARSLSIAPQTVNSHLKHIYQKLGVSTRRQAVARAIKTGLLPPA
jgi:LuxR family maltose regulon positive regulatory protein